MKHVNNYLGRVIPSLLLDRKRLPTHPSHSSLLQSEEKLDGILHFILLSGFTSHLA